ncbi:MAG: VWA domain-containing protein [Verrucomicrobiota bacterium]
MMPTFAEPVYFWMLLALIPLLLLRLRAHRLSRKGTPGLVAHRLRNELVIGANPWLRWLAFTFHCLALTFIIVALSRPQWGHEEMPTESEGRNIIIAIDTSRSMLATDLLPDRLTRARLAAQDLVDSLPNDRIGLIAFAGRAFLQAPLTMDHMAIVETLNQIDTEVIPRGGTNINSAVTMAIETFRKIDSKDNALIIFSDGEDLEGGEQLAQIGKDAEELGMVVIAIGVGTQAGSIIPDPSATSPGTFIKNDKGDIVRSRLDPAALQQLSARTSRGIYLNLGSASSIADIVGKALSQIKTSRHEDAARKRPIERFLWPLGFALLFMIAGFILPISIRYQQRRTAIAAPSPGSKPKPSATPPPLPAAGKTAALLLFAGYCTLSPSPLQAEETTAKTAALPALESYQNEDYQTAIKSYQQEIEEEKSPEKESQLHFGLGSAAYRTGDLELAEQAFGKVLERADNNKLNSDAHYNLGNTLFRHGQTLLKPAAAGDGEQNNNNAPGQPDMKGATRQWQAAIEHYQAALKTNPKHVPANENLKLVQNYLKLLQKKQQEQEQKKDQQEKEDDKKDKEDEDKDKEEDKEDGEKDDQGKGKDQKPDPNGSKDPDGNQPPPKDQDKNSEGKPDDNKDQKSPPPSDSKNPDGEKKPSDPSKDKPKDQQDGKPDGKQKPPQQPGQAEPEQKDPEGNLKANPSQQQPAQAADARKSKEDQKRNPETGFSPLEARRLLQSLSDEDLSIKPLMRPAPAQPYKNW